jgi:hypothetical protein
MIKPFFDWLKQPLGLIAVGIVTLAIFSAAVYGIYLTQQPPQQPIEFPHWKHAAFGIQCLYCHPGGTRGPQSGIPSQAKCWGCHQQIAKTDTSPLLAPLKAAVQSGTPIQWVPVAQVPDFVQYNHRAHIAAGQNCENCHGDLGDKSGVTVYQNPQVMNMGWCLKCHTKVAGSDQAKLIKLTDCVTCHY